MSERKDAKLPVRATSLKDNTDNTAPSSSAKFVPLCFPDSGVAFGDQVQPRWKPSALSSSVSAQLSSPCSGGLFRQKGTSPPLV